MTKTKLNRITIFIMNLWVNRVGQLASLAVALFFYSCTEEVHLLGYPNPNSKFDVKYIEIPLDNSMVFLADSVFTENNFATGETHRLLVGIYEDPKFGTAKSTAFMQYSRSTSATTFASTAVYDSILLFLQVDYYVYGSSGVTAEKYHIHELSDTLSFFKGYFNNSTIPYDPTPIGTEDTVVSFTYYKDQALKSSGKDTLILKTRLSDTFGQKIFNFAKNNTTSFLDDSTANLFYKGLAIVPNANNKKMVGFAPNGIVQGSAQTVAYSRMVLYYKEAPSDTVEKVINFSFNRFGGMSFNNIEVDRALSPELSGHSKYTSFVPTDNLLYSQSGDGVITSIDFSNFYDFTETIEKGNVIINSGELVFEGVEQSNEFKPISVFTLRALDNANRFKTVQTLQDTTDLNLYQIRPTLSTLDGQFTVINDTGSPAALTYSGNTYRTYLTLFLQELANKEGSKTRFKIFGLVPESPQRGKSVNRTLLNRNNIKLRVYYTVPTVKD